MLCVTGVTTLSWFLGIGLIENNTEAFIVTLIIVFVNMQYSVIQSFFYCGNIYKDEIIQKYRSKFRIRFSVVSVPSKSTIDRLVNRFRSKASLLMQKWQQTRCVIFEETSADMEARLLASQQIFKTAVAGDKCVQVTVQAATEFLQSKPYKFRVMPNLEDAECAARQRCCNWLCRTVSIGEAYLLLTYFTHQARFC